MGETVKATGKVSDMLLAVIMASMLEFARMVSFWQRPGWRRVTQKGRREAGAAEGRARACVGIRASVVAVEFPASPSSNGWAEPCGLTNRYNGTGAAEAAPHGPPIEAYHVTDVKKPQQRGGRPPL